MLVVAAEHVAVSDPAAMSAMHRRLRRSRFVVLDGAWHMSVFTEPDQLVDLLSG
jgi:pimeloyl-ACP methyl ester carboxylesterase